MRKATSIKPRPQEWLWQDRIPKGAITWIVGQPGNAKSLLTIEITAAATLFMSVYDRLHSVTVLFAKPLLINFD